MIFVFACIKETILLQVTWISTENCAEIIHVLNLSCLFLFQASWISKHKKNVFYILLMESLYQNKFKVTYVWTTQWSLYIALPILVTWVTCVPRLVLIYHQLSNMHLQLYIFNFFLKTIWPVFSEFGVKHIWV